MIFVSSQISQRRNNKINDFEIDISPEIDARSGRKRIILEEIIYPKTLSTIHPRNEELFKFKYSISFGHFLHHKTNGFMNKTMNFDKTNWIKIPHGHHSLKDLIKFMNKKLSVLGCEIALVMGSKCNIFFNKMFDVYSRASNSFDAYTNNTLMKKKSSRLNDRDQYDIKIDILFSKGLAHVLGFVDEIVTFDVKHSNDKTDVVLEYKGRYVVDPSFGLNFMCVTCDQIVPVQQGFEFKERLVLCPLQLSKRNNDEMSISYIPKNCIRTLRPGVIRSMHFRVEDLNGEKLYFNSGKIVLICSII